MMKIDAMNKIKGRSHFARNVNKQGLYFIRQMVFGEKISEFHNITIYNARILGY